MRILTVGNMYPPHHLGGYELVWQGAVEDLRARGHEVAVLTTDHRRPGVPDTEQEGVQRALRWWWRDFGFPRYGRRARRAVETHNAEVLDAALARSPDVVAWWSMGGMSLSLVERVRLAGLPAAGFVHDDWMLYGPRVDAGRGAVDLAAAARWVFVSEATRRRALEHHDLPDTAVAHSGIDHRWVGAAEPPRPWRWRLLYVGRVDDRKGVATAVEALDLLPGEATLTVVGAGDVPEHPRVVHAGPHDRGELPAFYAQADAVLFPVLWEEPWGLVPLEAMALGRPVVATGRGGSAEYLRDGENALLFPAGAAEALADAVRRLAADEVLRERLRAGGEQTAARHTDTVFNAAVQRHLTEVAQR